MNTNLNSVIDSLVNECSMVNLYSGTYDNARECPFVSELYGMVHILKELGFRVDFEMREINGRYLYTAVKLDYLWKEVK